jgi:hypothetical protein
MFVWNMMSARVHCPLPPATGVPVRAQPSTTSDLLRGYHGTSDRLRSRIRIFFCFVWRNIYQMLDSNTMHH